MYYLRAEGHTLLPIYAYGPSLIISLKPYAIPSGLGPQTIQLLIYDNDDDDDEGLEFLEAFSFCR